MARSTRAKKSTVDPAVPTSTISATATEIAIVQTDSTACTEISAKSTSSKRRFTDFENAIMIRWFENPKNFEMVYGTSGKTKIGEPARTAAKGYMALSTFFNKVSAGQWNLSGRAIEGRFKRFRTAYLDARKIITATGFGLTEEDRANGLSQLVHKREKIFPGYDRMEVLFGHRANVEPLGELNQCSGMSLEIRSIQAAEDFQERAEKDDGDNASDDYDEDGYDDEDGDDGGQGDEGGEVDQDDERGEGAGNDDDDGDEREPDGVGDGAIGQDSDEQDHDDDNVDESEDEPLTRTRRIAQGDSISITSTRYSSQSKRGNSVDSRFSNKRSRTIDSRRAPPSLNTGQSNQKLTFATAYTESTSIKIEDWEKEKYQSEKSRSEQVSKREKSRDRAQLILAAMNNGRSNEEIRDLLNLWMDEE
ncbi:hypothetical protein BGX28_000697 [Mortierella sp. GBA30]|nr:hypothetical protein BGX28_000697 [Mortierella sp. GBA30]